MNCTTYLQNQRTVKKSLTSKFLLLFFVFYVEQQAQLYAAAQQRPLTQRAAQAIGRVAARATLEAARQVLHETQTSGQVNSQAQSNVELPWYQEARRHIQAHPDITRVGIWAAAGGIAVAVVPVVGFVYVTASFIAGACTGEAARSIISYLTSSDQQSLPSQNGSTDEAASQQDHLNQSSAAPSPGVNIEETLRIFDTMTFDMRKMNDDFQQLRQETATRFAEVHQDITGIRQDMTTMQQQISTVSTGQQRIEQEQAQFRNFVQALINEKQRRTVNRLPAGEVIAPGVTVEPYEDEAIVPQIQRTSVRQIGSRVTIED